MKRGRKTSRERDGFPHTKTKYRHGDRDHTPKTMRAWRPLLWLEVCHSRSLLFPLSYLSCLPPLKSIKCIGCQEYFFCFRFALPSPIAAFFTIAVSELQLQNNIYIYTRSLAVPPIWSFVCTYFSEVCHQLDFERWLDINICQT